MIETFRLVFPYMLVLYFVIKGIKEPLYFLGIPFLMFMSESIFFEGAKLFRMPGSISYSLMLVWLIILRISSIFIQNNNEDEQYSRNSGLNGIDFCIIGLILITTFGLVMTMINFKLLTDVLKEFVTLISLFVSYFIIKNWTSNNKPELWVNFLFSLVVVNSIASLFYVLHQGMHLNIYKIEELSTEVFQNEEITRNFYFMPQFLPFSIAFLLVFKEKTSFIFYALITINLLAVFISYTRSAIINAGLIFLLYFLFLGLKKGTMGLVVKNVLLFALSALLVFFVLSKVLPSNTNYFVRRFSELSETSPTSGPNNMEYRFLMTSIIISHMEEDKRILGEGPLTQNQLPLVTQMRQATSDMVWCGVIFRWGFVGLMLFILLYLISGVKAFIYFMRSEGLLADLGLFFLLYIISQMIESFFSWTFMSGHGFATGLWYLAMLSALIGMKKNEIEVKVI
jgi:hypothetical protein